MLTTTPFFRPREGCEPMPITSMLPSMPSSPTIATTLEVPMSRPMIRFLSERLAIVCCSFPAVLPTDSKAVAVTHIDIADFGRARGQHRQSRVDETVEPRVDVTPAEPHLDAVGQLHLPCAARVELECGEPRAGFDQLALRAQVPLRDLPFAPLRAIESRQLRWDMPRFADEQLSAGVEQSRLAPACGGNLFGDFHSQSVRPAPLHA